jgi:DNA-binding MarR family transcriptional regulator
MATEVNTSLFKAIGLTSKLLGIYINENLQLSGFKLTRNQFIVLKILSEREGICQNDLAFITERDKTSLTRLISALELKGMVFRKTANDDRRKKIINITKLGLDVLNEARPIVRKLEGEVAKDITTEELERLLNVLAKVQANVLSLEPVIE